MIFCIFTRKMFLDNIITHPYVLLFSADFIPCLQYRQKHPIFCNTAFIQYCGFTQEYVSGKTLHLLEEVIHPEDIVFFINSLKYLFSNSDYFFKSIIRLKPINSNVYVPVHAQTIIQKNTNDTYTLICLLLPLNKQAKIGNLMRDEHILSKLSMREYDIACLLAHGKTNNEIADMLFLSVETIKTHRRNIKKKLKAKNNTHLLQLLMKEF